MVAVEAHDASTLWCLVWLASAGYLWCACSRGCVDGGGLSACLPVELVPALGGLRPVRVAVAVGVSALGAWWAWLSAGARVGVY